MAEMCFDCRNKINAYKLKKSQYIMSKDLDFCEECGEFKHVIVVERKYYYMRKFRVIIFPFKIIYYILKFLFLPVIYLKYKKELSKNSIKTED